LAPIVLYILGNSPFALLLFIGNSGAPIYAGRAMCGKASTPRPSDLYPEALIDLENKEQLSGGNPSAY